MELMRSLDLSPSGLAPGTSGPPSLKAMELTMASTSRMASSKRLAIPSFERS